MDITREPAPAAAPRDRDGRATAACVLDEQPHHLVPAALLPPPPMADEQSLLICHPGAWLPWRGPLPGSLAVADAAASAAFGPAERIWIDDTAGADIEATRVAATSPESGHGERAWADENARRPFTVGPAFRRELERLVPGAPAPADLSPRCRAACWAAGILTTPDAVNRAATADERARAQHFADHGYVATPGAIHALHLGALRRHYRRLLRTGGMTPERENPRRFVVHNDAVARFFHHQLAGLVGAIAGAPVKPSYAYVVAYQGGAALPLHTDRAQCEYSVTLLIDVTPETTGASPWPLYLVTSPGDWPGTAIHQALGDSLVYRGRALAHHRFPLPDEMTSTSILFHYVDRDFTGPLD